MNYSYSQIKSILFEEIDLTPEDINLSLALDMMHEMIRRKKVEGEYNAYKIAKFVAGLYNDVDPEELYDEWAEEEELEHEDDYYPTAEVEEDEKETMSESFLSRYKVALEMLDDLVKKNLGSDGAMNQTIEFYAIRIARQLPMIDPKKLAQKYRNFYNPVVEEKDVIEEISDDEFDKTIAKLLDTRLGDDLLDAIEKKDKKGIERILDVEIDNKKKAKEIVKRILD